MALWHICNQNNKISVIPTLCYCEENVKRLIIGSFRVKSPKNEKHECIWNYYKNAKNLKNVANQISLAELWPFEICQKKGQKHDRHILKPLKNRHLWSHNTMVVQTTACSLSILCWSNITQRTLPIAVYQPSRTALPTRMVEPDIPTELVVLTVQITEYVVIRIIEN